MCFYRTCRLQRNAITVSSVGRSPRQEKKKEERKEERRKKRRRRKEEKEKRKRKGRREGGEGGRWLGPGEIGGGGEFKIKGTDSTEELCLSIA